MTRLVAAFLHDLGVQPDEPTPSLTSVVFGAVVVFLLIVTAGVSL